MSQRHAHRQRGPLNRRGRGGAPRAEQPPGAAPDVPRPPDVAGQVPESSTPEPVPAATGTATTLGLSIDGADVVTLAMAARARVRDAVAEQERQDALHEVHLAGLELARELRDHMLHSLAECRGSHSAWDVVAESHALLAAQERYAAVVRRAAVRVRPLLAEPARGPA